MTEEKKKKRKGWAFYLGWAMVILPGAFSLEYWEVRTQNGWVIECYAHDYWTLSFGVFALVLAFINHQDWAVWSYGLGAVAISMIGVGLNIGDVLCPEYVPPGPRTQPMFPFF